jgi:haloacetate dehalogenase
VLRSILESWPASPDAISGEATQHYLRGFTAETIPGMCADYRASFHLDRQLDAEDRDAGRKIESPVLVHWGSEEGALSDSLEVWGRWADSVDDRSGQRLCQHVRQHLGHRDESGAGR